MLATKNLKAGFKNKPSSIEAEVYTYNNSKPFYIQQFFAESASLLIRDAKGYSLAERSNVVEPPFIKRGSPLHLELSRDDLSLLIFGFNHWFSFLDSFRSSVLPLDCCYVSKISAMLLMSNLLI